MDIKSSSSLSSNSSDFKLNDFDLLVFEISSSSSFKESVFESEFSLNDFKSKSLKSFKESNESDFFLFLGLSKSSSSEPI